MAQRNIVLGLAAVGVLVMWVWLLAVEILDTLAAEAGEQIVRSDLRIGVMTLLTGLLGAALAVLVAAGGDQLRDVPRALGFNGERLPQMLTFVYALAYVLGIFVGLAVAVTNEGRASSLLIAVATGGIGTLATGVAAWLGLNLSPPSGTRSGLAKAVAVDGQDDGRDGAAAVIGEIDLRDEADQVGDTEAAGLIEELTAEPVSGSDGSDLGSGPDGPDGDEANEAPGFRSIAN